MYNDRNWLIEQYWGYDLSLQEIGNLAGVTSGCIRYWMNKYEIPIRSQFSHLKELNQDFNHQSKAGKQRAKWTNKYHSHKARERIINNNPGHLMHIKWKERNPKEYHMHQYNAGLVGGAVRAQELTDWEFYEEYGCHRSQYPYPDKFNKQLKKTIFQRDGGICQVCHKLVCNGHAVHHIDYDKDNNDIDNLVLLCRSCHSATNSNRETWTVFFKDKGLPISG